MGDMNFPDPNTTTEHDGWDWDSEKWTKWGSGGGVVEDPNNAKAVASGVMTTGEMVVLNADGTVSVVAETVVSGGGDIPETIGSEVSVSPDPVQHVACCYDSGEDKVLAIYGYSKSVAYPYGTASVGTVSGDSISFGSPVVFRQTNDAYYPDTKYKAIYDATLKKSVIVFVDRDNYPSKLQAVLATISGDSVSFGSEMEVLSTEVNGLIDLAYDPSSKKYVAMLNAVGDFGTAVAFSVSDGSVASDSPVVFKSEQTTNHGSISVNPDGGDLLMFYCMSSDQSGRATAGAVSGDTIQFGSEINISSNVDIVSSSYNPSGGRHVLSYRMGGTGGFAYARLVNVNGIEAASDGSAVKWSGWGTSSIASFTESIYYPKTGMTVVAAQGAADYFQYACGLSISDTGVLIAQQDKRILSKQVQNNMSMSYDQSSEVLATFEATGFGAFSVIYSPGGTVLDTLETNLTQDNFIGVSKGDYSDGDEATVQIAGINADQQGMTIGKQYILPDGALTTDDGSVGGYESGEPSNVFAGTAISSTELNIKDTA